MALVYLTSGSISAFFKRFHVASLLKSSNIRKARGTSPARILEYMFTLIFEVQRSFSTVKLEIIIRTCYLISCLFLAIKDYSHHATIT